MDVWLLCPGSMVVQIGYCLAAVPARSRHVPTLNYIKVLNKKILISFIK